jgi:type II secretory pathway pseudopilin PulG
MSRISTRSKSSISLAAVGVLGLTAALLALGLGGASAKSGREGRQEGQLRAAGKPVLAIREAQRPIGNRC